LILVITRIIANDETSAKNGKSNSGRDLSGEIISPHNFGLGILNSSNTISLGHEYVVFVKSS